MEDGSLQLMILNVQRRLVSKTSQVALSVIMIINNTRVAESLHSSLWGVDKLGNVKLMLPLLLAVTFCSAFSGIGDVSWDRVCAVSLSRPGMSQIWLLAKFTLMYGCVCVCVCAEMEYLGMQWGKVLFASQWKPPACRSHSTQARTTATEIKKAILAPTVLNE